MLATCSMTEIPPKPSKKEQTITLTPKNLKGTKLVKFKPLVNSIIPLISGMINFLSIFKKLNNGENVNIINLFSGELFKIDMITLNNVINPPIRTIVFIEFVIEFAKISPRLL